MGGNCPDIVSDAAFHREAYLLLYRKWDERPDDRWTVRLLPSALLHAVHRTLPRRIPMANPTFNEVTGMNDRVVEAYAVTDDWLDLYDHQVRVEFAGFLRPQIKFDSAQDLIDELKRNVEETKRITA